MLSQYLRTYDTVHKAMCEPFTTRSGDIFLPVKSHSRIQIGFVSQCVEMTGC